MKKYIISLIILIASTSVFSQESKEDKPISIELSIRHERVAFNSNYYKDYFWEDGNFSVLSKTGNRTNIGVKTTLKENQRNTLFFGLGFNVYQARADNESIYMPFLDLELGHRFYILKIFDCDVFFENSINYGFNYEIQKYHLKGSYLDWKTGLHIEKPVLENLNLIFGMNYSLGLINASIGDSDFLRKTAIGMKIGIKKQIIR